MVKQLSVFVQNRTGKIASVVGALSDGGVDIRALSIADTADFGILRMLVSDISAAKEILSRENCILSINDVCLVTVPDSPGGLSRMLEIMSCEGVNIEYMYSLIERKNENAYMVMRVSDEQKFIELLRRESIEIIRPEQLGLF